MKQPVLSDSDLERIRAAVASAEQRTSGEIVPYVVGRSGTYEVAVWRAASGGALLLSTIVLGVAWSYAGWGHSWMYTAWAMALAMTLGGIAGALLVPLVAPLQRVLAGSSELNTVVHRRALEALVEEEVFNTRDRTGILLFVSLFERRIEVLGDSGINAKVQPDEWEAIVERIQAGIRAGALAAGLVDAIDACGELLHRRGVEIRDDDTDELPDDVRLRDS